jgi:hypothetical protein
MCNAQIILIRKNVKKFLLGRAQCKWKNNETEVKELVWEDLDWVRVAREGFQCRALVKLMNLVPHRSGNFFSSWAARISPGKFSTKTY